MRRYDIIDKTLMYYNEKAAELTQQYESANIDDIHQLLVKTFQKNDTLLEIGCGSGRDASFMIAQGYNLLAIDGSKKMIEMAIQCHPELEPYLEIRTIPDELTFENDSFDGIFSVATLMHLNESQLDQAFKKISAILKCNNFIPRPLGSG